MFNWSSTLPDTDVTGDSASWPKNVNNNKPDQSIQWPQNASTCVIVKDIGDFQLKLALLATKIAT